MTPPIRKASLIVGSVIIIMIAVLAMAANTGSRTDMRSTGPDVEIPLNITPVPTRTPAPVGVVSKGTPHLAPTFNPQPGDPWITGSEGWRTSDTKRDTQLATLVVSGTVAPVSVARWTTTDGTRPANPFAPNNYDTIYRPVTLSVDSYLKGSQSSSSVLVFALGGQVGADSFTYGDDLFDFNEGQRVVVFLYLDANARPATLNGSTLWRVLERYTVTANGNATNSNRTISFSQLLSEISNALK